jgi:high affinity Mn2+ porin
VFDYAADAWGYSAGAALEWRQGRYTTRLGGFLLSNVPNSTQIDTRFKQFEAILEVEERHTLGGRAGKLMLTGYLNRGRMGRLEDAVALARETGLPADPSLVRRYASRVGFSLNVEQELAEGLGAFLRAGAADGRFEAYEFTDVDRSVSGGLSLKGARWGRKDDTLGLAGVVNVASRQRIDFLEASGLGILVGDGRLPHPDDEHILEAYYDLALPALRVGAAHVALDYQFIDNPAYNADRGPVSVLGVRLHGQF